MSFSFDPQKADVVIIGGGPVALWTAIQSKIRNPQLNIVVLEKYAEYQRIHNLFIESASLNTDCHSVDLDELIVFLKGKSTISTKLLENSLAKLAEKVGVVMQKNIYITDPVKDLECFTNAKVIIGADGAHSTMRQFIVGKEAELCFTNKQDLHYIADLTYHETKQPLGKIKLISAQTHIGNSIHEIHSKASEKTTLRTFISPAAYGKMKHATRKNPEHLDSESIDQIVRDEFLNFLHYKYGDEVEKFIDLKEANITTTTLGCYTSEKMIKQADGRTYCLVGDAAFGMPFFRSLNNGLISGTHLSKIITNAFKRDEDLNLSCFSNLKSISSLNEESFDQYENYMQAFAYRQTMYAKIKSTGINSWISVVNKKSSVKNTFESKYLQSAYSI